VTFLIDNNSSPLLAGALKAAGHDAVHLRDLGMQAATDHVVLEHARADERILVSAGGEQFGHPPIVMRRDLDDTELVVGDGGAEFGG